MRFLSDGMLGRVSRMLRILGEDVLYLRDPSDSSLLNIAEDQDRVLLTNDLQLYRSAVRRGLDAHLVEGKTTVEKLARIAEKFHLMLEVDLKASRCPTCNSFLEEASRLSVKSEVRAQTLNAYRHFWRCSNPHCSKIYWAGPHWKTITATLNESRKLVSKSLENNRPKNP